MTYKLLKQSMNHEIYEKDKINFTDKFSVKVRVLSVFNENF
jgi:hypothetical protein